VSALADECRAIIPGEWTDGYLFATLAAADAVVRAYPATADDGSTADPWAGASYETEGDGLFVGHHLSLAAALLELHRRVVACGLPWPWPAPQVPGVRPAGWGKAPTQEEDAVQHLWLIDSGVGGTPMMTDYAVDPRARYCAIDAEGRWCIVDTRGAR